MKRADLTRHIERHGIQFLREEGNHSVYVNRSAGKTSTVPRHREINIPAVNRAPQHAVWTFYDAESDTLYVNFKKLSHATDSEMTEDDLIVWYDGTEVIGFTVLHAGKRLKKTAQERFGRVS